MYLLVVVYYYYYFIYTRTRTYIVTYYHYQVQSYMWAIKLGSSCGILFFIYINIIQVFFLQNFSSELYQLLLFSQSSTVQKEIRGCDGTFAERTRGNGRGNVIIILFNLHLYRTTITLSCPSLTIYTVIYTTLVKQTLHLRPQGTRVII